MAVNPNALVFFAGIALLAYAQFGVTGAGIVLIILAFVSATVGSIQAR